MLKIKKIFLLVFVMILIFSVSLQAQDLLEMGIEKYNKGSYQNAIDYLTDYAAENSDSYLSHFYLGLSYTELQQFDLAISSFNYARKIKGDSYNLLVNLARAHYNNNEKDMAHDLLIKAKGYKPIDEQVYNLLGLIEMDKQEYEESIEYFKKAIELEDDNLYVYNNISLAYIHIGEFKEAEKYIVKAVELDPFEPYVYNNAGVIYENLTRYEEALNYYNKALAVDPDYKKAEINLARIKSKLSEE